MKSLRTCWAGGWSAASLLAGLVAGPTPAAEVPAASLVRRQFSETDTVFANPGQGWMTSARRPPALPRLPYSVAYVRFNWADAEPEEGHYRWALIDDVIAAWRPHGVTVALRVMTCNAHSQGYYTSPKWLFDAGCKGHEYLRGGDDPTSGGRRIPRIEPDYADPLYLEKHGAFLRALGARYDGHPDLEFVDIGSYGIWGEWHTPRPAPLEVRQRIVDLYLAAFRRTPLVFMSDDAEVLAYALSRGTGFRRDGVGSPWHEQNWIGSPKYAGVPDMGEVWKRAPIVFEWFGDYDYLRSRQWSFEAAVDFMLRNHVTVIHDNLGRVPPQALPRLLELARRAGARFVLREIVHPAAVRPGTALPLTLTWANTGVGRMPRAYRLHLALADAAGRRVTETQAPADPQQWLPGEHTVEAGLPVPATLAAGEYAVLVALLDPTGRGRPWRLALEAPEQDGWYRATPVHVSAAQ